ncbi:unnamed protein product [Chondrus crispus]|uniref:Uncharacterized protein n=1 Tax=Chondrus crispus TaxID=2769 RepID=R7QPW6_CHOCR|nr:unnamed protein product [Chondrus crispus]CDF40159.1 unnamed protein product [Chondrus crispus]|eukprot:XP_005710453.1 unnamed protein product [Chondrus crispus]
MVLLHGPSAVARQRVHAAARALPLCSCARAEQARGVLWRRQHLRRGANPVFIASFLFALCYDKTTCTKRLPPPRPLAFPQHNNKKKKKPRCPTPFSSVEREARLLQ